MRLSVRGDLGRQTKELRATLAGGERLDFVQLRLLRSGNSPRLVRLMEERETRAGRMTLRFELSGLSTLRSCLRRGSRRRLSVASLLADVVEVLDWLAQDPRGSGLLLFDPRYVYVDGKGHLRFVLLPVRGLERGMEQSPSALLGALADLRHDRGRVPNERETARRLAEFLGGEGMAFSANRLRTFVQTECGRVPEEDQTMVDVADEGAASASHLLRVGDAGSSHVLVEGRTYEVGRGQACDVRLQGCPKVSRTHASIRCEREGVRLMDLGSTNGTYVAGRRLVPHVEKEVAYGEFFYLSDQKCGVGKGDT